MYKSFRDTPEHSPSAQKPRICIVTSEAVGPFKNGGIGTSMTGLAKTLAQAGFPVTLLYTASLWRADSELAPWKARYAGIGIEFDWLRLADIAHLRGTLYQCGFSVPAAVYAYLSRHSFDVVHFNDCMGEGFYCLAMKRQGAAFAETLLSVAHHGPSQWLHTINRFVPVPAVHMAFNYAERLSLRCADLLWSPSRYLLDWSKAAGFEHPAQTVLQQYAVPDDALFEPGWLPPAGGARRGEAIVPDEIVFFARLEERKGIGLFCEAIARIDDLLAARNVTVTFLGKPAIAGGVDAMQFIRSATQGWKTPWRVIANYGQQEALAHLRAGRTLAVMPSPADNSPCTVYEALAHGVRFIAAHTGGIPELIAEADRDAVLFDYTVDALAAKLSAVLEQGQIAASPARSQPELRQDWIDMHARWRDWLPAALPQPVPSAGILALVDCSGTANAGGTLAALADNPRIARIVLIDRAANGSTETVTNGVSRRIARGSEAAATLDEELAAGGERVLLLRAGVSVDRDGLDRLCAALDNSGAAAIVSAARHPHAQAALHEIPLGGSQAFGFYFGTAPTGCTLAHGGPLRAALKSHGIIPELEFFGLIDMLVADGAQVWPHADPVAQAEGPYSATPQPPAIAERIAMFAAIPGIEQFYIASMGFTAARATSPAAMRWRIGLYLSRFGLGRAVKLARRAASLLGLR